jgi:hypothetical protein
MPMVGRVPDGADGRYCTDARQMSQTGSVNPDSPKSHWARPLPGGPPIREELARLVDSDEGRDDAENGYFESANDPQFVATETAQRRFNGTTPSQVEAP